MTTPNTTPIACRIRRHRRRTAAVLALSSVAAAALAVTGNASAGGSDPASDSSAGLPGVLARAAKAAPLAVNGPSDTTVSGEEPSTSSDAPSGQPVSSAEVPSLDATTQQAATAVAGATQNNVQNIVVIIRINSPGDDVISQSNTANAEAAATNDANTAQGNGTPSATRSPPRVASAGLERERPEAVARPSGDRPGAQRRGSGAAPRAAAANRTPRSSSQHAASAKVAPRHAVAPAERPPSALGSRKTRTSVTPVPARMGRAAARAGTGAAHTVGSYVPQRTPPAVDTADSISPAVILTLLAVLLAVVLGAGATYVPSLRARAWR
jgi:hypothetical protein